MVIIIGNQKGGVGKSMLTLLLANFLTIVKKNKVTVLDLDYQQSLAQRFESAKVLENEPPYEVVSVPLENFPTVLDIIKSNPKEIIIIDLPGKLDDPLLKSVYLSCDMLICPFSYDENTITSTIPFVLAMEKLLKNSKPFVFIPNRIKTGVKYETRDEIDDVLRKFGNLTPSFPDRADFGRATTVYTPVSILPIIQPVFDTIYTQYIKSNV